MHGIHDGCHHESSLQPGFNCIHLSLRRVEHYCPSHDILQIQAWQSVHCISDLSGFRTMSARYFNLRSLRPVNENKLCTFIWGCACVWHYMVITFMGEMTLLFTNLFWRLWQSWLDLVVGLGHFCFNCRPHTSTCPVWRTEWELLTQLSCSVLKQVLSCMRHSDSAAWSRYMTDLCHEYIMLRL